MPIQSRNSTSWNTENSCTYCTCTCVVNTHEEFYLPSCYQQTRETQALILSPTRELAQQIQKVNLKFYVVLFIFLDLSLLFLEGEVIKIKEVTPLKRNEMNMD